MAWTNITVVPGQPAFATQFNVVQANITAQANGDPGAPQNKLASMATDSVGQGQIIAASVGQSELKTSIGDVNNAGANANFLLPGGEYGFFPQVKNINPAVSIVHTMFNTSVFTSFRANLGLGSNTAARQRYVTASRPYDIGHGEISSFVFAKLSSDGEVLSTYVAEAPPWAYNGKTDIRPDVVELDEGGNLIKKKWVICQSCPVHPSEGGNPSEYAAFMSSPEKELVEIGHDIKNADMADIPHPFVDLGAEESVVLIDPTSEIVDQLAAMHENGEDIGQLIINGYIVIGDEITDCNKPNGVCVHKATWKAS